MHVVKILLIIVLISGSTSLLTFTIFYEELPSTQTENNLQWAIPVEGSTIIIGANDETNSTSEFNDRL